MKIAYCIDAVFPSTKAHTVQAIGMCGAFCSNDNQVFLIAQKFTKAKAEISTWYNTKSEINFTSVSPLLGLKSKRFFGLAVAIKLRSLKPDLVYSRCFHSAFFSALFGLPTVYEAHTPPRDGALLTRLLMKILFRLKSLSLVVAISENVRTDLLAISKIDRAKVVVMPTGSELSEMDGDFELSGSFPVAYAGSFYPGKGGDLILRMARECPWADFHLAGSTNSLEQAEKLPKNVHLHGHLPPAKIPCFLKAAACLIAPFSTPVLDCSGRDISRWTSPLKIFEYLCANRPIIATGLPGVKEVLNESNAFILEDNQLEKWVETLQIIENEQSQAKLKAQAGLELMTDQFTWSVRAKEILNLIHKASP